MNAQTDLPAAEEWVRAGMTPLIYRRETSGNAAFEWGIGKFGATATLIMPPVH